MRNYTTHGAENPNRSLSKLSYLRSQDVVTRSNADGDLLAVDVKGTGANSKDLGNVLLLDAALGEEDTRGGLGLGLDALDQDTVEERGKGLDVTEDRLYSRKASVLAHVLQQLLS